MADEFSKAIPQQVPNTLNQKVPIEKPWDVREKNVISLQERTEEELKRDDVSERVHTLYNELRSSLIVPSALKVDLKKARQMLEEVSQVKIEVEKMIEMFEFMEKYMQERIKIK